MLAKVQRFFGFPDFFSGILKRDLTLIDSLRVFIRNKSSSYGEKLVSI